MASELEVLNYAVENNMNVLLMGKHGVGKTAMVKEVFEQHGLNWQYFSASTIDPWVDLVGVPKEKVNEDGTSYLELVRPKSIAFDDVEAIFLDEYNRAPKKVRNAVMELIQFGSINGKKLGKLRIVFAAINPDDDEEVSYDVDRLDPAQLDRFHIHLPIDYKPNKFFFKEKFGAVGVCAVKWWNDQPKEAKELVSPRRLEYAVKVFITKGDIRYVFPAKKVNVKSFADFLDQGDPIEVLDDLITRTPEEIRKFFADHNSFNHVKEDLFKQVTYVEALSPYVPEEELMSRLKPKQKGNKLITFVSQNPEKFESLKASVLRSPNAYNGQVVDAFKNYSASSGKIEREKRKGRHTVRIHGETVEVGSMNIVFTGALDGFTREQATNFIEGYGAQVSTSVNLGVTHAVVGSDAGSKRRQAEQKGVTIIEEDDWNSIVNQLTGATTTGLTRMISINNRTVNAAELTLDNYEEKTGMRFRMTKEQTQRLFDQSMNTRDEARQLAFEEFIDSLTGV